MHANKTAGVFRAYRPSAQTAEKVSEEDAIAAAWRIVDAEKEAGNGR